MFPDGVVVRDYDPESDLSYVTDSWRRSYEYSKWSGTLPTKVYVEAYKAAIQHLLDLPSTKILIVCTEKNDELDLDENFIIGYVVYDLDRPVVHYLYIKEPFRRKGIGKALLTRAVGDAPFKYTFRTAGCEYLRGRFHAQFNPKLIREKQNR